MVKAFAGLIFALICFVNGSIFDDFNYLQDSENIEEHIKEIRQEDISKRSSKKQFCVFSQEAKDSKFIDFLNEVSRSEYVFLFLQSLKHHRNLEGVY